MKERKKKKRKKRKCKQVSFNLVQSNEANQGWDLISWTDFAPRRTSLLVSSLKERKKEKVRSKPFLKRQRKRLILSDQILAFFADVHILRKGEILTKVVKFNCHESVRKTHEVCYLVVHDG